MEDLKGKHHVGPSGRVLRREFKKAGIDPNAATYLNAVCCWPKGAPKTEHLMACRDNLIAQWGELESEYVLVLGRAALEAVLPHATKYTRDKAIPIHGKIIYPIYHPNYVSRDPTLLYEFGQSLRIFGLIIQGWGDAVEWDVCPYCQKMAIPACRGKHMAWWRKDQAWKTPPPPQLSLGLDV